MDTNDSQANLDRLADLLLQWGGQAALILDHMVRWADRAPADAPSIPETLNRLIRETLGPLEGRFSAGELALGAAVLDAAVRTLQEEIILVPRDAAEDPS